MSAKKVCFFITPISSLGTSTRKQADFVTGLIQEVINEFDYGECKRADFETKGGNITTQIIEYLLNSDLVIADLSNSNANVFYELGIRHATNKPFVQIINEADDNSVKIPFDLSQVRSIPYKLVKSEGKTNPVMSQKDQDIFQNNLRNFIRSCELRPFDIKSPITEIDSVIPLRSESEPIERIMADMISILAEGIKLFQPPSIKSVRGMSKDSHAPFIKSLYEVLEDTRNNIKDLSAGVINCSSPLTNSVFKNFMDHVENEFKAISVNDLDFWLRAEGKDYLDIAINHIKNHKKGNKIKLERIFVLKDDYVAEEKHYKEIFLKQLERGVSLRFIFESSLSHVITNVNRLDFGLFDNFAVSFFRQTKGRTYTVTTSKDRCEKYHRYYDNVVQICLKINKENKIQAGGPYVYIDHSLIEKKIELEEIFEIIKKKNPHQKHTPIFIDATSQVS